MAADFPVLVDCVKNAMSDDTITHGVFRIAETEKSSPRRVVWVPTTFTCKPVLYANSIRDADTGELADILFTDFLTVECHVSGNDFEDADLIRRAVCNAVRQVFHTSSKPTGGVYVTEQTNHSGLMWGGKSKILQLFEWEINVPRPDHGKAIVTTIEQTSELIATTELLTITEP